jgi:uncharacterized membrane protein YdjX (TVP38/TMEM64 family)
MPADDPTAPMPSAGRRRFYRLVPVVAVLLGMAAVFLTGLNHALSLETVVRHRAAIDTLIEANYPAAIAGFILLYVVMVSLSVPGAACLTISGGIMFGGVAGGLAAIVGGTVGAVVIFLIARSACREFVTRRAGGLAARLAAGFHADAFSYLLFLRLVPAFPFWLVNLAAALVGVELRTFFAATALGVIPGSFAFAVIGAGLDSVIGAQVALYRRCLAAGGGDCRLDFSWHAMVTPELMAALAALGVVVLIPVIMRHLRAGRPAAKGGDSIVA